LAFDEIRDKSFKVSNLPPTFVDKVGLKKFDWTNKKQINVGQGWKNLP